MNVSGSLFSFLVEALFLRQFVRGDRQDRVKTSISGATIENSEWLDRQSGIKEQGKGEGEKNGHPMTGRTEKCCVISCWLF